jgi:hypothetical protein
MYNNIVLFLYFLKIETLERRNTMPLINTNIKTISWDSKLGEQRIFRAKNGFGASVINYGYGSEDGLLELAVIQFTGENDDYYITYDTSITGDVIGYLTETEVEALLKRISRLHRRPVKFDERTHHLVADEK